MKPRLFIGFGTEVVVQAMLPLCRAVLERTKGEWPDEVFVLMADSDRRAQNRFRETELPSDRVAYLQLSLQQVRKAIPKGKREFKDVWRKELEGLVKDAPDNGACMVPALGRLLTRAARPAVVRQLRTLARHWASLEVATPDVFFVLNPLSGTSRGSISDLPAWVRAVWPEALLTALVVYPVDLDRLDPRTASIYQANFIEALRTLEYMAAEREVDVYIEPKTGWEKMTATLIDNVLVFDAIYGNERLEDLDGAEQRLEEGLSGLFNQVVSLLAGIATRDELADWLLGRLSDVTMHRSGAQVASRFSSCHALHETHLVFDGDAFRRALVERAVQRVLAPLRRRTEAVATDLFSS